MQLKTELYASGERNRLDAGRKDFASAQVIGLRLQARYEFYALRLPVLSGAH